MRTRAMWASALAAIALMAAIPLAWAAPQATPTPPPPTPPAAAAPGAVTSGWTLLKEGEADGTIEADAKNPANPSPHILRIAVTKYASQPGMGRVGARNTNAMPVKEGQIYDITFTGISEGIGVGLVVSLENGDGKVLARTTLPEIGRGGRGGGGRGRRGGAGGAATGTAPATQVAAATGPGAGAAATPAWRPYLVSLTVRAADPAAHLVITPIEPVPVWLDGIAMAERKAAQ